jgi:hypothetical protein
MSSRSLRRPWALVATAAVLALAWMAGCGEKGTPVGKNLLKNPSFEKVVDGMPDGWRISPFRGMETDIPATWGVDTERAYSGEKSFYFEAHPETRRFFFLTQTVEVKNVGRLRVRGALRTLDVEKGIRQYPQANYALTCFDKDGNRFESTRYFDLRTPPRRGTSGEWILEDRTFRIPDHTVRVDFHCAVGMQGRIWFDAVSLEVAESPPWRSHETRNFTFHWLPGHEFPDGSMDFQQQLFDNYCTRLGIPEVDRPRIDTFLYPDTVRLFEEIGEHTARKSFWDDAEIHSIYPVDDHEIIHIVLKPYGVLPFALGEGTAFYLIGEFEGEPVLKVAQNILNEDRLPTLLAMVDPALMNRISARLVCPAAASFVGYLLEMFGPEKFLELHRQANAARTPGEFKIAFDSVYGRPVEEAEVEWRTLLARLDFSRLEAPDSTMLDSTDAPAGTMREP